MIDHPLRRACLGALLFAGPSCWADELALPVPAGIDGKVRPGPGDVAPIGTATMLTDGTILLQLRATSPGALGDVLLRYEPADSRYQAVRDHLPALRPGGTVAVPPFR